MVDRTTLSKVTYLIGAGPGDPSLITVKGQKILARADVILYDHLASERLLDLAPARVHSRGGRASDRLQGLII